VNPQLLIWHVVQYAMWGYVIACQLFPAPKAGGMLPAGVDAVQQRALEVAMTPSADSQALMRQLRIIAQVRLACHTTCCPSSGGNSVGHVL
jgi:hypothetical protein